jgi:hypothetical protein
MCVGAIRQGYKKKTFFRIVYQMGEVRTFKYQNREYDCAHIYERCVYVCQCHLAGHSEG